MIFAPQNVRGALMEDNNKRLGDATNAVQFLQADKDGSRQGNLYLSSMPGATEYNGYNTSDNGSLYQYAVFGGGPLTQFSVAGP